MSCTPYCPPWCNYCEPAAKIHNCYGETMTSLKKLSDAATEGEWGLFDDRGTLEIGHAASLGERPCIVGWPGFDCTDQPLKERRANARFIVALVNAYRAGLLRECEGEQ